MGLRGAPALAAFAALAVVVACTARADPPGSQGVDEDVLVSGFPDLPADARDVAERLATCSHFAGEFNGDGSDRDREVTATMAELRCDRMDADAEAIRQKYADDPAIHEALTTASQL